MDEPVPEWLVALRLLRTKAGSPTIEHIATHAALSHQHVSNIFRGFGGPSEGTFRALLDVLTNDPEDVRIAWAAFDRRPAPRKRGPATTEDVPPAPLPREVRTDGELIAEGLNNVAQGLADLAAAIHSFRISEEERHP